MADPKYANLPGIVSIFSRCTYLFDQIMTVYLIWDGLNR